MQTEALPVVNKFQLKEESDSGSVSEFYPFGDICTELLIRV